MLGRTGRSHRIYYNLRDAPCKKKKGEKWRGMLAGIEKFKRKSNKNGIRCGVVGRFSVGESKFHQVVISQRVICKEYIFRIAVRRRTGIYCSTKAAATAGD